MDTSKIEYISMNVLKCRPKRGNKDGLEFRTTISVLLIDKYDGKLLKQYLICLNFLYF